MKRNTQRVSVFFIAQMLALAVLPTSARAEIISSAPLYTHSPIAANPLDLYIPSIELYSPIKGVGVDKKGNMDVPSGRTNNVGWYKYGVVPGHKGTAVLDAHNTAAFKDLDDVEIGEDIYIKDAKGKWLHFKVTKAKVYDVKTLKPTTLFLKTSSKQINLITCAGTLLGNGEATHRLIVSAELATEYTTISSVVSG